MYYNFGACIRLFVLTPVMETGIANHVWSIDEIVVGLVG